MSKQTLNNGETGSSIRSKINSNFSELYTPQQWVGKTFVAVGTSVLYNPGPGSGTSITEYINAICGISIDNKGLPGSATSLRNSAALSATIAEHTAGTVTNANGTFTLSGGASQSYENKVITAGLGYTPDVYLFFYGENEPSYTSNVGTLNVSNVDRDTIVGSFNYIFNAIYNDNPDAIIIMLDKWQSYANTSSAILESIANLWGIPFVPIGRQMNSSTKTILTWGDGTHPNATARLRIAYTIAAALRRIA